MLRGMVRVRPDHMRLFVLGIELQHLGRLVVGPDHGVEEAHIKVPFVNGCSGPAAQDLGVAMSGPEPVDDQDSN